MNSIGEELIAFWRCQNIAIPKGNTERRVKAFESRYKVFLPPDFRDYFLRVDGMDIYWPNAQDKEGYSFWPLKEVKTVSEEARTDSDSTEYLHFPGAESLFLFADYLDWSWAYAIRLSQDLSEGNPVYLIGRAEFPIKVADSFSAFVELYFVDSPILYGMNVPPEGD